MILLVLAVPVLLDCGSASPTPATTRPSSRPGGPTTSHRGLRPGLQRSVAPRERSEVAGRAAAATRLRNAVAADPDVAQVSPVIPSPNGSVLLQVVAEGLAAGREHDRNSCTGCAITSSRERRRASGLDVHVGGQTAVGVDLADILGQRLPYMFLAILLLSFVLLMLVFRSLLVPLKAVIMNLLSIGAAYGVIVAIFQYGWIKNVVGIGKEGPIEAWVPMMLFAIVFGLSMDYEVFLLCRIKEEYDATSDNADGGRARPRQDGPAHHRGRRDHDLRVRQLRALRPAGAEADRLRSRVRGVHRRDGRPARARAGHDGAARRPQLVVPEAGSNGCRGCTSRASQPRSSTSAKTEREPVGVQLVAVDYVAFALQRPLGLAERVALGDGLALVVARLAPCGRQLDLGAAVLEVDAERHEGGAPVLERARRARRSRLWWSSSLRGRTGSSSPRENSYGETCMPNSQTSPSSMRA